MPEAYTASYNPVTGERREFRQEVAPPPPPDYGMSSINPAAVEYLYRTQKIEDAEKAIAAAIQFQGLRGYQQALKENPNAPEKALAKWGPQMFYSKPQAFGPSVKALTPPQINPNQAALLEFRKQQAAKPRPPIYRATPGGGTAKIGADDSVTQIIPGAPKPDLVARADQQIAGAEYKKAVGELETAERKRKEPWTIPIIGKKVGGNLEKIAELEKKRDDARARLQGGAPSAGAAAPLSEQAQEFKTAEEVGEAFRAKKLSREAARKILTEQFGM